MTPLRRHAALSSVIVQQNIELCIISIQRVAVDEFAMTQVIQTGIITVTCTAIHQ